MDKVIGITDNLPVWFLVEVKCNWCASHYYGLVPQGTNPDCLQCCKCDATMARVSTVITKDPMTKKECLTYVDELLEDKNGESTQEENGSWGGDKSS